jgi:mRNA interferase RelE/StbE
MRYSIEFAPRAQRDFDKFDQELRVRIARELDRLAENPFRPGTKALKEYEGARRARVGDYRIIYRVINQRVLVLILHIGHRREVYRSL